MLPIQIDVAGFGLSAASLRNDAFAMAAKLGQMKEPLTRSIEEVVIPSIELNFVLGGRPRWESLSEARRQNKTNPSSPILIDTRKLVNAATSRTIWRITNTEADMQAIDNRVEYAKFHQGGTRKMPQRQFAIIQTRDVDDIVEIFEQWLAGVTIQNWRGI